MDEELKSALKDGEKILWQGKPESFVTLDKTNKKSFVIKAVITAVICVGLIIAYGAATIPQDNFKPVLPLVVAGFGILIASSAFLDARRLRKIDGTIHLYRLQHKKKLFFHGKSPSIGHNTRSIPITLIFEENDLGQHVTLP